MATRTSTILDTALAYMANGLSIIPTNASKQPEFSLLPQRLNGQGRNTATWEPFQERAADESTIRHWFGRNHPHGLAIVAGQASGGLLIIDFDTSAEAIFPLWRQALAAICPELAEAFPVVRTGKGYHLYMRTPNPGGNQTLAKDAQGHKLIETRGQGGYCVAPPTVHENGNRYQLIQGDFSAIPKLDEETTGRLLDAARLFHAEPAKARPAELATEPAEAVVEFPPSYGQETPGLEDAIRNAINANHYAKAYGLIDKLQDAGRRDAYVGIMTTRRREQWANKALEDELAKVEAAPKGTRNEQLFVSAKALGQLAAAGIYAEEDIRFALEARAAGYIADDGERQFRATMESGLKAGRAEPRDYPPELAERPRNGRDEAEHIVGPSGGATPAWGDSGRVERFNRTDLGNARRLVAEHGENIRHVHAWGAWLVWDGQRWAKDKTAAIQRLARQVVAGIYAEATAAVDEDERKATAKWAMASESRNRLDAMEALARAEPGIPADENDLDANPWLLNVANGTLNLQTGQLQAPARDDLITKRVDVAYHPEAECPQWLAFLGDIMNGNEALIAFLQRAIGYSLSGSTREQCLFFMYGTGQNGKSTFMDVIAALAGEYWQKTPTETLLVKEHGGGIPNDVARLPGVRLVVAAEVEQGKRLAESLVKDMTGGDELSARFMRGEWFTFRPAFKLWLYGNHKPVIRGTDAGIWRRIRLIPFNVTIPDWMVDKDLPDKLKAELPGILAWAVRGCLEWQGGGLREPNEVTEATAGYRSDMDALGAWLDECCELEASATATAKELFNAYQQWCKDAGERAKSQRHLGFSLRERGLDSYKSRAGVVWQGLQLSDYGQKLAAQWENAN